MSANQTDTTTRSAGPSSRGSAKGDIYDSAVEAYDSARERASEVTAKAGDQIEDAPLIALAGGLAAGALLAAILPRTKVEDRLIGPAGERLTGSAKAAVEAAKDAGREKFNELNLTRDAGAAAVQTIISGVSEAAVGSVRKKKDA